ncbi:hypothetical protein ACRRS0_17350 [Agarivorans sp. QJM3NY_29]|uniref:hypothetical protein n=1 Tax=unclassified Agarivorans TaxID=2636026 RepID=UPI003D7E4CC1
MTKLVTSLCTLPLMFSGLTWAETASDDLQDMSDPLAVYTQVGGGITDMGLNLKIGQSYDTGVENLGGMNVFEVKGFAGDITGWSDSQTGPRNNSIDSIRFRNFEASLESGRGRQLDVNYNLAQEFGTASYSFIQALPKFGQLSLFPLLGAGVAFGNNVMGDHQQTISGYSVPGTFAVVGTYAKYALSDRLWLNYNPMWMNTLSGSDIYKQHGFEDHDSVLTHEIALSYQVSPRFNIRYFANWSEYSDISKGNHRIEFNYQL